MDLYVQLFFTAVLMAICYNCGYNNANDKHNEDYDGI